MILSHLEVPNTVPETVRKPLGILTGEVRDLSCVRQIFWDLCINPPDAPNPNLRLTHDTARVFFFRLRCVLLEHLIIGIARLTDPAKGRKKGQENLTFSALFGKNKPAQIRALQVEAEDIRLIRNKIVAHLDSAAGLDPSGLPNKKILRKIRSCVDLMVEIIGLAWSEWVGGTLPNPDREFAEIENCLKKALAYDMLERAGVVKQNFWAAGEDLKADFLKTIQDKR
jgi:hypothetical protein